MNIPAQPLVIDNALKIGGWMSEPELLFLAETASRSSNILEVGTFKGRSTKAMADNTSARITCVDPWDSGYQVYVNGNGEGATFYNGNDIDFSIFYSNLSRQIKSGQIRFFRKTFNKFSTNEKYDFIFIDALHDYENCLRDIKQALQYINKGIIAGHDYGPWPGVDKAVKEIFGSNYKVVDTIWYVNL